MSLRVGVPCKGDLSICPTIGPSLKGSEVYKSLSTASVASIIFACTFAAALLGMLLRRKLPAPHWNEDSKDVMKLVMGLIATMAALVLALLIASAKSSYDTQDAELQQVSATVIELDGLLAHFGPDAREARRRLQSVVSAAAEEIGSKDEVRLGSPASQVEGKTFFDSIQNLSPNTKSQRFIQKRAFKIGAALRHLRALMISQASISAIPWPFLTVLVFWISVLFLGFGLFARLNAIVIVTLLMGALSVSSGIYLILELNNPYHGLMRISAAPLRKALAEINH